MIDVLAFYVHIIRKILLLCKFGFIDLIIYDPYPSEMDLH